MRTYIFIFIAGIYSISLYPMQDTSFFAFSNNPSITLFAQNIIEEKYNSENLQHYSSDIKIIVNKLHNIVSIYFIDELKNPDQTCSFQMPIATFCSICGVTKKIRKRKCNLTG